MIPDKLKQARLTAEKIFEASTKVAALTVKGEEYLRPPKTRYLVNVGEGLFLTHRIPWKPWQVTKQGKRFRNKYTSLCTIRNYAVNGLDPKAWDTLIDTIMEAQE